MLTHAPWRAVDGLRHGFCDRGECLGRSWDDVVRNVAPLPVVTAKQVHGTRVVHARPGPPLEADGLVTDTAGEAVGIVTADCVPVLLRVRGRPATAAVHAGWRGAAAGVLEAAVRELCESAGVPAGALEAAIGPAVGACCYEVREDVRDAFHRRVGALAAPAFSTRGGRLHLDLRLGVERLLAEAGVRDVAVLGPCTACDARYASYRRDGAGAGRQLSFIGFEAPRA